MLGLATLAWLALAPPPEPTAALDLRDGDMVVQIGGTFVERGQEYGYLETILTAAHPDADIRFRNLGWSGDTVFGHARAGFGTVEEGFAQLKQQVAAIDPTVILVAYGTNEAFEGEAGLPKFREGLNRLLDTLEAGEPRKIVLISPPPMEDLGPPLPDPSKPNANFALYRDAIREVAAARHHGFVDLFALLGGGEGHPDGPLTDNGLHFTEAGYRVVDRILAGALGASAATGAVDESLRRAIVSKNRLYFYRWRPQNETYLFGFRKHEQGQNAREVPLFDPLVAEKESEIARFRRPSSRPGGSQPTDNREEGR